ncbi:MAG TPA: hypothetical protein VD884_10920 [Ohtaekwangia sp.]|nr:hypothetical protein [Ohtaekwangia sp.]
MIRNRKLLRVIATSLAVQFVLQALAPSVSYALTSGPSQPEFSSYEPVSSTNMVDEFSGDFIYNLPVIEIPGPHGSSYPLSLSYHSGVTPEEEASWVGLGWTLNPGSINRATRGIPDDFNGQEIKFHNKMPKNWTATVGYGVGFEAGSIDARFGYNTSLRYNNYRGFGYNTGLGVTLGRGVVSLGYSVSDGEGSFSLSLNPTGPLNNYLDNHRKEAANVTPNKKDENDKRRIALKSNSINLIGSRYGIFSFNDYAKPVTAQQYSGASFNVSLSIQENPGPVPIGVTQNLIGSYAYQQNTPSESVETYGYLYSAQATSDDLMDFHTEKETPYNKRDVFLGVPFNDADNFTVSGEGIGGGFRFYNKRGGHFNHRKIVSTTDIYQVGGEADLGFTLGAGVDVGKGKHTLKQGAWKSEISSFASIDDNSVDEPVFFRFNNDLGGEWGYNHNDKPVQASIQSGLLDMSPSLSSTLFEFNENNRSGRSSYIAYTLNNEMISANGPTYKAFNKNSSLNDQVRRSSLETKDLIGEIAITNETGARYLYALPVYNRNEKMLSHGVARATNIKNRYVVYDYKDEAITVGQVQEKPYASAYLLTEIVTPDYVDKPLVGEKSDGPTANDLGGYTRFNYQKITDSENYYKWRAPYSGLFYSKNSHSDPKDDLGSYSEGEKEIYYLQSVETKSHVAIFVLEDRLDSREAPTSALSENPQPGSTKLKLLSRIDLYAISDCQQDPGASDKILIPKQGAKAIKSVVFKYNYSLCTNTPNSTIDQGDLSNNPLKGKLTLERVHFEYNGINTTKISPYIFKYNYPTNEFASYPDKYTSGDEDVTENYNVSLEENPQYSVFNADAWGYYQPNGQQRFNDMRPWIDQQVEANKNGFDPAAWHLKAIQLPSGGEIHIQYEQDDYAYVQDQEAHVMVSLKSSSGNDKFYLDLNKIGVTNTQEIVDMIHRRYVGTGKKMYFKFLYRFISPIDGSNPLPTLSMCNADFITGYANVLDCDSDGQGVFVILNNSGKFPKDICQEFVKTQRLGMIDPGGNCVSGLNEAAGGETKEKAKAIVRQLFGMINGTFNPAGLCQRLNPAYSYLRVPTPNSKKGGGVRVKRLLIFDRGIESEPALFGNEYIYQTIENNKIISSGVATNEPQTMREENILVDFVARKNQPLFNKLIAGKDKKQAEGPIGESILPGPSVGYSKITIRNIHSGKTQPGFSISEFYTAKDYPVILADPNQPGTMTPIDAKSPMNKLIPGLLVSIVRDKTWATQGFSFILNSMHGQLKSKSTYSGPYTDVLHLEKSTVVSSITHDYFPPGEKIPVMNKVFGEVTLKNPGREVDMTFAQKRVEEESYDANIEGDIEVSFVPPFVVLFYPTAMPTLAFTEGGLYTHVTTKVVRYPAILKKTTVYQDGILHTEEVLALDEYTGKAVAIKSKDEFKGAYVSQSIPASWEYPSYKQKAITEGRILKSSSGQFQYSPTTRQLQFNGAGCGVLSQITKGDVLELAADAMFQVENIDYANDMVTLLPITGENGTVPSSLSEVKIVRSGRNNKLSESAGSLTFHNPDANAMNVSAIRKADSERYVSSGTSNEDGSLFIKDLNEAFVKFSSGVAFTALIGPYYHMNLTQYVDNLPSGCNADLTDATVKNINLRFKDNGGTISVELGTFEIKCGDNANDFEVIKMPN